MRYVLDTSAYSAFRRSHAAIKTLIETANEIILPPIVIGELLYGFTIGSREARNRAELQGFLSQPGISIGGLDETTAERYGLISSHVRKAGRSMPTNDVWIAAFAMQHGLEIITTDRHFTWLPQVSTRLFGP